MVDGAVGVRVLARNGIADQAGKNDHVARAVQGLGQLGRVAMVGVDHLETGVGGERRQHRLGGVEKEVHVADPVAAIEKALGQHRSHVAAAANHQDLAPRVSVAGYFIASA